MDWALPRPRNRSNWRLTRFKDKYFLNHGKHGKNTILGVLTVLESRAAG